MQGEDNHYLPLRASRVFFSTETIKMVPKVSKNTAESQMFLDLNESLGDVSGFGNEKKIIY